MNSINEPGSHATARVTRRILLVRWGRANIHDYVLASLLFRAGFEVEFALLKLRTADNYPLSVEIEAEARDVFRVHLFHHGILDRILYKLDTLLRRAFRLRSPALFIGLSAPKKLRRVILANDFDHVIAIEQHALYWVSRAIPGCSDLLTYYNLEVLLQNEGPHSPQMLCLLAHEQSLFRSWLQRLLIQDFPRQQAILSRNGDKHTLDQICRLPLPVLGDRFKNCSKNFFRKHLDIPDNSRIVLYFGAVYAERQLDELVKAFRTVPKEKFTLVLHGSPAMSQLVTRDDSNVFISQGFVPLDQLNTVIGSCDVGLALYDTSIANTRHTAFSSEKITRYLQCGKPFIAFRSESFEHLRNKYRCCELIESIHSLPDAVVTILDAYDCYSAEAFRAFEAEYSESVAIPKLAAFFGNV